MREIGYAKNKANSVEDVGLARSIETSDGVKVGVKVRDNGARGVGLKAIKDYLLNPHRG